MPRKFDADRLVIASHNRGKVREIADLLAPFGIALTSAADLGLGEPEETGATFRDNARIKAVAAAEFTRLPALADDSGLAVAALDGAPGVRSARWAGPERDFGAAMDRVEQALSGRTDRSASFICALALCWPGAADGTNAKVHCEIFEGRVDGHLVWPPRGGHGFGYDPMFVPGGHDVTFGEMEPAQKHAISHRADALRQLVDACFGKE
ncbi:MAG: RdgB/HAM1 family non-canonical purine NTP pyrophosphatase [Proteobacteria bacterium]|nr:RdgB/HAM1 family non-canonical purine NTP pyrophosphatase [Pseudomonadota bacterium]